MGNKTQRNPGVTIFIIFLIPLLVISNISLLVSERVIANQEGHPIMQNNFSVAGIPLENLSKNEAIVVLEKAIATINQEHITIQFEELEWTIAVSELNINYDIPATVSEAFALTSISSRQHIPLVYQYDKLRLQNFLEQIAEEVNIPAIDAKVFTTGNRVEKTGEQIGRILHVENLLLSIQTSIANALPSNHFIISLTEITPKISSRDIREIDKHFATYTTQVNPDDKNRIFNIQHAINFVEAFVVSSNSSVHFNKLAGPYTSVNGYTLAPVLSNGMVTEGYGGGVCQVSSTLFVAALKAGLSVDEHHHHDRPVQYVPLGYDATVVEASDDLKLKNNNRRNIYISINYSDYEVQVDIYGNQSDYVPYSLETRNKKTTRPKTIYHLDVSLTPYAERIVNNGEEGYILDLYRTWSEGNQQQEELISNFHYQPIPKVIHIGEKHWKANEAAEGKGGSSQTKQPTGSINGQLG